MPLRRASSKSPTIVDVIAAIAVAGIVATIVLVQYRDSLGRAGADTAALETKNPAEAPPASP